MSHFPRRVRARLGAAGLARAASRGVARDARRRGLGAPVPTPRRPASPPRPHVRASAPPEASTARRVGTPETARRSRRRLPHRAPPRTTRPRARLARCSCSASGYTSLGLANVLLRAGWRVSGTVRDAERAASLAARGVDAHVWRPDDGVALRPDALDALRDATHVLNSVPPVADFDRDPVLADPACVAALREKLEAVDAALAAAAPGKGNVVVHAAGDDSAAIIPLRWLGYLSSTSVYGDAGGAWVDETTRGLAPTAPKAVARLDAENAWRAFFAGRRGAGREGKGTLLRVFRLGGIYGPGRSALEAARRDAARLEASEAAEGRGEVLLPPREGERAAERRDPKRRTSTAPGEPGGGAGFEPSPRASRRFTSRCHVGDVVATLCASIRAEAEAAGEGKGEGAAGRDDFVEADGSTWRTYNVVDDAPAPRREAMAYAARLLAGDFFVDDGAPGADGAGIRIRGAGAAGEDGRARTAEGGREGGPGESKNTTRGSGGGGVAEKRVRNDRIKRELGVRLMFPTYREGLAAIVRGDATPFGADER